MLANSLNRKANVNSLTVKDRRCIGLDLWPGEDDPKQCVTLAQGSGAAHHLCPRHNKQRERGLAPGQVRTLYPRGEKVTQLAARFTEALRSELMEIADLQGITLSRLFRQAVLEYVQRCKLADPSRKQP